MKKVYVEGRVSSSALVSMSGKYCSNSRGGVAAEHRYDWMRERAGRRGSGQQTMESAVPRWQEVYPLHPLTPGTVTSGVEGLIIDVPKQCIKVSESIVCLPVLSHGQKSHSDMQFLTQSFLYNPKPGSLSLTYTPPLSHSLPHFLPLSLPHHSMVTSPPLTLTGCI